MEGAFPWEMLALEFGLASGWPSFYLSSLGHETGKLALDRLPLLAVGEGFKLAPKIMGATALPVWRDDPTIPQNNAGDLGEAAGESPLLVVVEAMAVNRLPDLPH